MIRVVDVPLPGPTALQLASWQTEVTNVPAYKDRVTMAQERFAQRNRRTNPVFATVRQHLDAMCHGSSRCVYCEDSLADEVEHVRPKALFPDEVFVWRNYIYACGPCNGAKRSNYPRLVGQQVQMLQRRKGDAIVPPPPGIDLLIDPRTEDPAAYLMLDLGTQRIVPLLRLDSVRHLRAMQTIEVLRLDRSGLIRQRAQQFANYVARLKEYLHLRDNDDRADAEGYAADIRRMGHPTVWNEIRRHQVNWPQLHALFVRAPEAIAWDPLPQGLPS